MVSDEHRNAISATNEDGSAPFAPRPVAPPSSIKCFNSGYVSIELARNSISCSFRMALPAAFNFHRIFNASIKLAFRSTLSSRLSS